MHVYKEHLDHLVWIKFIVYSTIKLYIYNNNQSKYLNLQPAILNEDVLFQMNSEFLYSCHARQLDMPHIISNYGAYCIQMYYTCLSG